MHNTKMTLPGQLIEEFKEAVKGLYPTASSVRFLTWPAAPTGHLFSPDGAVFEGDTSLGKFSEAGKEAEVAVNLAGLIAQGGLDAAKLLDWSMNDADGDTVVLHLCSEEGSDLLNG